MHVLRLYRHQDNLPSGPRHAPRRAAVEGAAFLSSEPAFRRLRAATVLDGDRLGATSAAVANLQEARGRVVDLAFNGSRRDDQGRLPGNGLAGRFGEVDAGERTMLARVKGRARDPESATIATASFDRAPKHLDGAHSHPARPRHRDGGRPRLSVVADGDRRRPVCDGGAGLGLLRRCVAQELPPRYVVCLKDHRCAGALHAARHAPRVEDARAPHQVGHCAAVGALDRGRHFLDARDGSKVDVGGRNVRRAVAACGVHKGEGRRLVELSVCDGADCHGAEARCAASRQGRHDLGTACPARHGDRAGHGVPKVERHGCHIAVNVNEL